MNLRELRDDAIQDYRSGEGTLALGKLEKLYTQYPTNMPLRHDLIIISSYEGQGIRAFDVAAGLDLGTLPEDVEEALVFATKQENVAVYALRLFNELYVAKPESKLATRGLVAVLTKMRAFYKAFEIQNKNPTFFSLEEKLIGLSNVAGTQTRWGNLATDEFLNRHQGPLEALTLLQEVKENSAQNPSLSDIYNRARYDEIVVLVRLGRMDEAETAYVDLKNTNVEIPQYVELAIADVYSYNDQPELALPIHEKAYAVSPKDVGVGLGYYYSLMDNRRYQEAVELVDKMEEETPAWYRLHGSNAQYQHPDKMSVATAEAFSHYYAGDNAKAQKYIEGLAFAAPGNGSLLQSLGEFYNGRGWHEKAEDIFSRAHVADEKNSRLDSARAGNLYNMRRFAEAEEIAAKEMERQPENRSAQRLDRQMQLHNMKVMYLSFNGNKSDGETFGSTSGDVLGRIYSAPVEENWRYYIPLAYRSAEFVEGDETQPYAGFGLEYRAQKYTFEGDVGYKGGTENGLSTNIAGNYYVNDYLSLNGDLSIYGDESPLRAAKNTVRGNGINVGATYKWNESTYISTSYGVMNLEDGNHRQSASTRGGTKLYSFGDYSLDGAVGIYASRNSETNVFYFAPSESLSASVSLVGEGLFYRKDETSFRMGLGVEAGPSWQEGHDTADNWDVRYYHKWDWNDELAFSYGVSRSNKTYDGDAEDNVSLYGDVTVRF